MKFAFKFLQKPNIPWVNWFFKHYPQNIAHKPTTTSFLRKIVNQQLPTIINSIVVTTFDGNSAFFC